MTLPNLEAALALVDELERGAKLSGPDAEMAVHQVLKAAGYAISDPTPLAPDQGIDMRLDAVLDGRTEQVGVEVKGHNGNVSGQTIMHMMEAATRLKLDRVLVISLGRFTPLARQRVGEDHVGRLQLLDIGDLRGWLRRHAVSALPGISAIQTIIKTAMRALAFQLAQAPEGLYQIEWRDMERLLGEVFETLGFKTTVTPSAQDGGYDVRLTDDAGKVYLIEVKHWVSEVGGKPVRRLVEVTASQGAAAGVLLATGGFSPSIFDGRIELQKAPIHLGDGSKIVSLCKAFYRAESQLWQSDQELVKLLISDTVQLTPKLP